MGKNADRAKELLKDVKAYNPGLLKELKAEGTNPLEYLESFLDGVDKREQETLETLKEKIPQGLEPEEYERELNWKRQTARELANAEVMNLLRG